MPDHGNSLTRVERRFGLPDPVFPFKAFATSRVELTLDANLLPSKVVFPEEGKMRPIRQQTGQRRYPRVSFASMANDLMKQKAVRHERSPAIRKRQLFRHLPRGLGGDVRG